MYMLSNSFLSSAGFVLWTSPLELLASESEQVSLLPVKSIHKHFDSRPPISTGVCHITASVKHSCVLALLVLPTLKPKQHPELQRYSLIIISLFSYPQLADLNCNMFLFFPEKGEDSFVYLSRCINVFSFVIAYLILSLGLLVQFAWTLRFRIKSQQKLRCPLFVSCF